MSQTEAGAYPLRIDRHIRGDSGNTQSTLDPYLAATGTRRVGRFRGSA
jgi:hypothetical protein